MRNERELALDLIHFIDHSPTAFHVVANIKQQLNQKGFKELDFGQRWNLQKGEKYYVTKNDSAIIAFIVGTGEVEEEGFKIVAAHTDSPTFRIKPNPEMTAENYLKLNTEIYGGPILNTWLDRPLSLAGRVMVKGDHPLNPKTMFVNIERPLLVIPNVAIHMNRKVNEGIQLNPQIDLLPIIGLINETFEKDRFLHKLLGKELNISEDEIIDFDLFLYDTTKGTLVGLNEELISIGRLDNLAMVHAEITAIADAKVTKATNVMVCFDNEEIGSRTKQGANAPMLANVLERIVLSLGKEREDYFRALAKSFMISADMAHAVHPNHPEKYDPVNKPKMNGGPVIKINANQNYTTDADSNAVYEQLCKENGIPVQKFVNRSDERGGSTIGPISSTQVDIRSIDIGTPMLAMHSIRELAGIKDHLYVVQSFDAFYRL
ncbi:M18 family aminopeptidase [Tepidibacillus fermentans]|uniref:Probable M18 family aminopeptidase 2 n=1 Tax=Tepidibacillus fermentans TaxID=1281767 RepID=A0A4R3KJ84_9BACI|nr:M18 family aminopeptidase [Tepidibacillus fermentans]TCS83708.1 aspartyl aminopeptidase [Tepidibacillus fermentans]